MADSSFQQAIARQIPRIVHSALRLALATVVFAGSARAADSFHFVAKIPDAPNVTSSGDSSTAAKPLSGRLYVFLSQRDAGEPRFGPNWFRPEPFFGLDASEVKPGANIRIDDKADGFPDKLSTLPAGKYRVQALLDHNLDVQNHAHGAGNLYSEVTELDFVPESSAPVTLVLDRVVNEPAFPTSDRVHEVVLTSELLSKFHGRPVVERAAVVLPASYHEQPQRRYPVVYEIPGFGGTHRVSLRRLTEGATADSVEFIYVGLSGNCKWGHHVYADSATNGPRGAALVQEMIPRIDQQFRTIAAATARFVTGHSSGGWTSLWLQVTYPDTFGGVWSTSPDPVDFRDFQQVNLYADPPLSVYFDEQGRRRPIARQGDEPKLWFPSFGKMDDVIGRGGQLRSFEAAFSPRGTDGLPMRLWERTTGRIDPAVAKAWEKYDIRLILERNWDDLGPKLRGKLHITTGELDTFYLEGAVEKLAESLKSLDSDAAILIVPGKGHGDILTGELRDAIRNEMSAAYRMNHPKD